MKAIKTISKYLVLSAFMAVIFALTSLSSSAANVKTDKFTGYDAEWEDVNFSIEYTDSYEFTGSKISPKYNVYLEKDNEKVLLQKDVDYYEYSDNSTYPSSYYECYISSAGNYEYEFYYSFDYAVTYNKSKISVSDISAKTYTGSEIRPAVKVYYGETLLSKDFYDVYYYDCYDAGTGKVSVEMGYNFDYYTIEKKFTINPAAVKNLTFGSIKSMTYSGYSLTPVPKVTYKGNTLYEYDDYNVSYKNNINAGTATLTMTFKGNYKGKKTIDFTINKLAASKLKYDSIPTQDYTGSKITPYIDVYTSSWKYFEQGKDFTVTYSNNKNPGTASATLNFKNKNISGTKKITFKIAVAKPIYLSSNIYSNEIELSWGGYSNYTYQIYKYDSSQKKYVKVKTLKSYYYTDKKIKDYTTYKYRVRAYVKIGDKTYYSAYSDITVKTQLLAPSSVNLTTKNGSVTVSWSKNSKATGYYVYRYDETNGKQKKVYTAKKNTVLKYVDKSVKNYNSYTYWVVAYKTKDGKTTKSGQSYSVNSLDVDSITRGVKLKSKTSYKVYSTQGTKTTLSRTVTLSSADIATLKKFAKKHFKSGMTAQEKVSITLDWIHSQVTYASSTKNWNKICNKTYVDAIFNYKLGQCAQYNGALAGMMTYLGYDVQMIKGYRHYNSQHFWVECKINGLTYVMECGNKKDGSWHYYFVPYKYTSGYTKNGKYVSGR